MNTDMMTMNTDMSVFKGTQPEKRSYSGVVSVHDLCYVKMNTDMMTMNTDPINNSTNSTSSTSSANSAAASAPG